MSQTCGSPAALSMLLLALVACGDGGDDTLASEHQTPPMGAEKLEAWLAQGAYLKWHCEPKPHLFRAPSPHGFNRICSNDLIADNVEASGDWPKGAAAVKELYAAEDGEEPVGYAVYLKTAADSAEGASWYWYERVPPDNEAPHDADGVVVDGMGDTGLAKTVCVSCHNAAGADAAHTPSVGARDQVYTPVP